MATIVGSHSSAEGGGVHVVEWPLLLNGDTGTPARLSPHPDKTIQIFGTFSTGGSVTLQGSNDGTNWATLHDPLGDDLTFTAAGIAAVMENPVYIRPNVTAGDGSTSLTASLAAIDND